MITRAGALIDAFPTPCPSVHYNLCTYFNMDSNISNISCPKISERYLSGSDMCLASHGMIEVMLMQTLTKNIPALKTSGESPHRPEAVD